MQRYNSLAKMPNFYSAFCGAPCRGGLHNVDIATSKVLRNGGGKFLYAHRKQLCCLFIYIINRCGACVGFQEKPIGGGGGKAVAIVPLAIRQIETGACQLPGLCRLATEPVYYPGLFCRHLAAQFHYLLLPLYAVQYEWFLHLLGKGSVRSQHLCLQGCVGSSFKFVYAALTYGNHVACTRGPAHLLHFRFPGGGYVPRVYAHRAGAAVGGGGGAAAYNACDVRLASYVVCVKVYEHYGTGSYPSPPHGWQRSRRRTARYSPFMGPCLVMASTAYCEQVGVKRQDGGVRGDIHFW